MLIERPEDTSPNGDGQAPASYAPAIEEVASANDSRANQEAIGGADELEVVATIEVMSYDDQEVYITARSARINFDNAVNNDALVFQSDAQAVIDRLKLRQQDAAALPATPGMYADGQVNADHTLFNEIRISSPVNEEGEPTQYLITEAQLQRIAELEANSPRD